MADPTASATSRRSRCRVALAQVAAGSRPAENLQAGLAVMERVAAAGATAVVFPELSFLRFFPQHRGRRGAFDLAETIPGPTTDAVTAQARRLHLVTVINLFERAEDGACYDASPIIDADGTILAVSRMQHIAEEPGFHEQEYYTPGPRGPATVVTTAVGRIGVAICYDRHYASVTTGLALAGADLVCVPQAGVTTDPLDLYEVEMQAASFQHGYQIALCNRVGEEEALRFAGRSFLTGPDGQVLVRAAAGELDLVLGDLDPEGIAAARMKRPFLRDLRRELLHDLGNVKSPA